MLDSWYSHARCDDVSENQMCLVVYQSVGLQAMRNQLCFYSLGPKHQPVFSEASGSERQQPAGFRCGAAAGSGGESTIQTAKAEVSEGVFLPSHKINEENGSSYLSLLFSHLSSADGNDDPFTDEKEGI